MVELNHRDRTIKVKLVYYGPPVGGKTTNLQILHRCAEARRRGELISINSAQDRTILFDLLPLRTPGFRGFDLRLQVLAVPGQAMYSATRRLVLKGADSLVFVANSALDRWEENIQSLREMTQNLVSHHLDPEAMPLVFQYNKRDLPQVLEIEALDRALNARKAEVVPAIAVRGEGVLETLGAILARTVHDLATRYAILDVKEGAPARQWAEQARFILAGDRPTYIPWLSKQHTFLTAQYVNTWFPSRPTNAYNSIANSIGRPREDSNFFFLSAVNWVLNGQLVTTNAYIQDIDNEVMWLQSTNVYRYSRSILFGVNAVWYLGRSGRYTDPFIGSVEQRTNELEFTLTYEI